MRDWTVVIHLHGMREFARIVPANNSREAIDRAWGIFDSEIDHAARVLSEHDDLLHIWVIPHKGE